MNWIEAITTLNHDAQGYVLVTVLATTGSSPRDTGTKMVVSESSCFDTIGGGALEYKCIELAREFLLKSDSGTDKGTALQHTKSFNLGKDLKQCCGGVVNVFFEVFPASNFNIVIFGAGHIAKCLVKILEEVDCQLTWFDSRSELFPDNCAPHIHTYPLDKVEIAVDACNASSYFLVMTHDHALDQQICEAVLSRNADTFCGLIGSSTKGLKFRQRLMKKGFGEQELNSLHCPVGLSALTSKKPMEIAVSISAELLQLRNSRMQVSKFNNDKTLISVAK